MGASENKKIPYGILRKSVARLAAVQALYSTEVTEEAKEPAQLVLDALHYEVDDDESEKSITPDEKLLKKLVYGVLEEKESLDEMIQPHLVEGWDIVRLGGVMRSLLRVAVYEIKSFENLSLKTLVNEYLNLARGFFNEQEVGFVNGILDRIGHKLRG